MAPDPSINKRKRGRPPNASNQDADADASQEPSVVVVVANGYDADADADDGERPKKRARRRGRSSMQEKQAVEPAEEEPEVRTKRKRGRPSLSNKDVENEATEEPGPPSHREKRTLREEQAEEQEEGGESQARPRERRGKAKKRSDKEQQSQVAEEGPTEPEPPPRRKRGRPSQQEQQQEQGENSEQAVEEQQHKPRKRGRSSLQDMQPAEVHNQGSKPAAKKDPKARAGDVAIVNGEPEPQLSKRQGKRRGRPSGDRDSTGGPNEVQHQAEGDAAEPDAQEPSQTQTTKSKRRRSGQNAEPEDEDSPASPPKPYTHIAPHIHRVRQSTIEAKWSPLTESSLAAVSSILHLAHRPILQRLSNTQQRRDHTSAALRLITHRITRKISKGLPFPPTSMTARMPRSRRVAAGDDGRAAELDFESVLDAKQALERQLDPALHAVELLAREKEKLERELERDYEALRNLESSARAQTREHRGLLKKAHVLAPTLEVLVSRKEKSKESQVLFRHDGVPSAGGLFDNLEEDEEEVKTLGLQLNNHIDSIKNNLQQTDGIIPQLSRSRAALQDVLFRYLDQGQYENVLLKISERGGGVR
ncbi:hypothetical protein PT974_02589 [Cladobotryum mycophilum]|uniref:Kinetochore protein fta7 n=1 Tax=Cladobotryum mycophilum TaxID=491253 RepID=A0ABR0SZQ8_9HYPO